MVQGQNQQGSLRQVAGFQATVSILLLPSILGAVVTAKQAGPGQGEASEPLASGSTGCQNIQ